MSQSTEADQSPLTPKPRCTAGRIVVGHDQAWLAGLTFSLNRIGRRHKGSDNLVLAAKPVGNLNLDPPRKYSRVVERSSELV